MRFLNTMRYNEILEATQYPTIWYHGSNVKIDKFTTDHIGKSTTITYGPGVYFTSDKQDARIYGKYIHTVEIKIVKSKLLPAKKAFSRFEVKELIDNKHSNFKTETFENWGPTPKQALPLAVDVVWGAYSPNRYKDMLLAVWGDYYDFNGGSAVFLKEILGSWDGRIEEKSTGVKHFICFNPDKVKIINVEEV